MDPVSVRIARRFLAENVFRTKMAPSISSEKAGEALRKLQDVLDGLRAVVKKIVASRLPPLGYKAREGWTHQADTAAFELVSPLFDLKPYGSSTRGYQPRITKMNERYVEAVTILRKAFSAFHADTYDKTRDLPDGTDFSKAIKSAVKAWALRVYKAIKDMQTAAEEYVQTLLDSPDPSEHYQPDSVEEFQISGLRFVVFDPKAVEVASKYADKAERAFASLKAKGFGKVWYGTVLLKSHEPHQLNGQEREQYRALGYENLMSSAGSYHSGSDEVVFTANPDRFAYTIVHEFGHRWWYKMFDHSQRARYNDLVRTNPSVQTRDWPSGHTTEDGAEKPVTPVSNYGKSSIEEAFAEAFTHYVLGYDMDQDQAESFRSVLTKQAEGPPA